MLGMAMEEDPTLQRFAVLGFKAHQRMNLHVIKMPKRCIWFNEGKEVATLFTHPAL